ALGGEGDVVVLGLDVIELGGGNDVDVGAVAHHDAFGKLAGGGGGCAEFGGLGDLGAGAFLGAGEGGFEAVGPVGLEQVIGGVDLEGAQGVLIVGGGEDDGHVAANQFKNFETIELGHLDIEEEQVGLALGDSLDCLEAVGAFGDDLDFGMMREHLAEDGAGEFFVVDDYG